MTVLNWIDGMLYFADHAVPALDCDLPEMQSGVHPHTHQQNC